MIQLTIGIVIIFFMTIFHRKEMRVEWSSVSKFLAFLSLLVCVIICKTSFLMETYGLPVDNTIVNSINNWTLGLVFWEDAFFVIPVFLFRKYISNSKKFWIPIMIAFSIWFGTGHLYQGYLAASIVSLYPFFISYRYGVKVGFGTVMVCHILYDHVIIYISKLLPYLLN